MIKLNSIFKVEYGQRIYHSKSGLLEKLNGTPLISTKGIDNGVHGFYDITPKYKDIISVASTGTVGSTFYHPYDCCVDDNCLVLTPLISLTENEMFYYAYLIGKESYKYLYGRQVTPKRLGETLIPDLTFVKNKISSLTINKSVDSNKLNHKPFKGNSNMHLYKVVDLFDVLGTKTTPPEVIQKLPVGKYPYITTKSVNNGVEGCYNIFTELGNCLTIDSATIGSIFYQEFNFTASDHVEKLVPKKNWNNQPLFILNKYIGLFLVATLRQEMYRYNYGRKFNQTRIRDTTILLPSVNLNGVNKPDWQYMEDYIKSLEYSSSI